ncbi:MAG TPA: hypothetical protein VKH41_05495 [Myxococcota bacterium]|nr:hypothetical protein [Myxococcota bacterium]
MDRLTRVQLAEPVLLRGIERVEVVIAADPGLLPVHRDHLGALVAEHDSGQVDTRPGVDHLAELPRFHRKAAQRHRVASLCARDQQVSAVGCHADRQRKRIDRAPPAELAPAARALVAVHQGDPDRLFARQRDRGARHAVGIGDPLQHAIAQLRDLVPGVDLDDSIANLAADAFGTTPPLGSRAQRIGARLLEILETSRRVQELRDRSAQNRALLSVPIGPEHLVGRERKRVDQPAARLDLVLLGHDAELERFEVDHHAPLSVPGQGDQRVVVLPHDGDRARIAEHRRARSVARIADGDHLRPAVVALHEAQRARRIQGGPQQRGRAEQRLGRPVRVRGLHGADRVVRVRHRAAIAIEEYVPGRPGIDDRVSGEQIRIALAELLERDRGSIE